MLLKVSNLNVRYGKLHVLHDLNLELAEGQIAAVIGHNGAGKSTLPKAIYGLVPPLSGTVHFAGEDVTGHTPAQNVRSGMYLVPQGRSVFPGLTVNENLLLGAYTIKDGALRRQRMEEVLDLFPLLGERIRQSAGSMSGGEQRLVALGMALMNRPKLLFIDEPSIGLSPNLVQKMMGQIREINKKLGTTVLLVEQRVKEALEVADRVFVLRLGRVALESESSQLLAGGDVSRLF